MKRWLAPLLSMVILIATALALYNYLAEESTDTALLLSEIRGAVSVTGPGRTADQALTTGIVLNPQDAIATGEDALAILSLGEGTRIRVEQSSSVQVRSINQDGVSLDLEDGVLQAEVRPTAGSVSIRADDREITSSNAEFRVGFREGIFSTESSRGELMLTGVPGVERINAGERLTQGPEQEPIMAPIPEDLLLNVTWPAARTREDHLPIRGTTEPGARVRVSTGEHVVEVMADAVGEFEAAVPLREGDNDVDVSAVDVFGEQVAVTRSFERDTQGPSLQGTVGFVS